LKVHGALLIGSVMLSLASGGRMFMYIDEHGVPVVTDRPRDTRAVPYEPGDFEAIALGQKNTPHRGLLFDDGDAGFGGGRSRAAPVLAPADVKRLVLDAAQRHGVPASLLLAVVAVESRFNPHAVSRAGAAGLMQLMPATAKDLGVKDPFDARENVDGGARYLAFLRKHFKDDALALAAYNAGPGRVMRAGNRIPDIAETRAYVVQVSELARAYATE
jgi:Transglycosylase SLT domain